MDKPAPTYPTIEILRILHADDLTKSEWVNIIEILMQDVRGYSTLDMKIIIANQDLIREELSKKIMADAQKGVYEPLQQLKDVLNSMQ